MLLAGGEDVLHAGLRVVEVAAHGAYAHVRALLRGHLRLLHGGDAAVRVKDDDARAGHVVEALERGLAGVAGGGGQDDDLIVDAADRLGRGNQARQQAQRDVLERARRAAEELEDIAVAHLRERRELVRLELPLIALFDERLHIGNIRKERGQNARGHGQRILAEQTLPVKVHRGQIIADVQAAVGGDALQHGGGGARLQPVVSRALIVHTNRSYLFLAFCISL